MKSSVMTMVKAYPSTQRGRLPRSAFLLLCVYLFSYFISPTLLLFVKHAKKIPQSQPSRQTRFCSGGNPVPNLQGSRRGCVLTGRCSRESKYTDLAHQQSSSPSLSYDASLNFWFATLTKSSYSFRASLSSPIPFRNALLPLLSDVRTPQYKSCPAAFLRVCDLAVSFFASVWQLLRVSIFHIFPSFPLTSLSRQQAAFPTSVPGLAVLPHTLLTAATSTPPGVHTPKTNSETVHNIDSRALPKTDSIRISQAEEDQDEAAKKRVESPLDAALKHFYNSFPNPPEPPGGVIELDAATWDIIADVVGAPQQQQANVRKERSSATQSQEQNSQKEDSWIQHKQEHESEQQQLEETPSEAAASSFPQLVHSEVPYPPRLWFVAFMVSGCAHCQRLRPVLQKLQRLYSRKLQQLRAARRHALEVQQQEATTALLAAARETATAHRALRQLSGKTTPEAAIKIAEQHTVALQKEEQTLQQNLLMKVSELYAAGATAAWAYPDIVFATFDCMQNREHQAVCGQVIGVTKFPTVLLLRRLPLLSTLAARAAEEPPHSLVCHSSLLQKRQSSTTPVSPVAPGSAASVNGLDSIPTRRTTGEEIELHFTSAPLLHERHGQHRRPGRVAAAGVRSKGDREEKNAALLCALQKDLLAEFPAFVNPSLQRLLLFLHGSVAEVASWAPTVPPPASFLEYVLISGSASPAATSILTARPAASQGAATEFERLRTAAAEKATADAISAAASAASIFLEKEQRRKNSNNFTAWLANRMRGEAIRHIVSAEEARLLHYGTATPRHSSCSCSTPTVSFLVCLDLARVLQTERGDNPQSTVRVPPQYLPQQDQPLPQQPYEQQARQQRHQQQQRQKEESIKRRDTPVKKHTVRLDGLLDAFETFAAAAGELRREHLFLYSLDPDACSPGVMQTRVASDAATLPLLSKMPEHSATATDTAEAVGPPARAATSPTEKTTGDDHGGSGSEWENQSLRVMALQPALLVKDGEEGDACNGSEETGEPPAEGTSEGDEGETEITENEEDDSPQGEVKRSRPAGERGRVLLLQYILEGLWAAQRDVAAQQQEVGEDEAARQKPETAADQVYPHKQRREGQTCKLEEGSAHQGGCVDSQEQKQEQQQNLTYALQLKQWQDESGVLEENDSINVMRVPTFVGPFPRRMDHLKSTALEHGPAAAAVASFFSAAPSPPLASFLDVFRLPTLPIIGHGNFMHLRVSSSRSWLSAAGIRSTSSGTQKDVLEMGRRQLVVAALDLRVLDTLMTLFQKPQITAAVDRALEQQQQTATFARMSIPAVAENSNAEEGQPLEGEQSAVGEASSHPQASGKTRTGSRTVNDRTSSISITHSNGSDSSSGNDSTTGSENNGSKNTDPGWLGRFFSWLSSTFSPSNDVATSADDLSADQLRAAGPSIAFMPSPSNAAAEARRIELVAAALSGVAVRSGSDNAVTTAAAARLLKLVDELWQLSWTVREVLMHSQMDLLHPLNTEKRQKDSRHSSSRRSPMTVFSSPFLFGILDGFGYSDSLAEFDVNAEEEGELPAVLAFDPLLPPSARESASNSTSCNSNHMENCSSAEGSIDRSSSLGIAGNETADGDGADPGTLPARKKKRNITYVPYYYRDRNRLRLEDLPRGLSLLRARAIKGRTMEEEEEDEEDEDEEISFAVLFRRVINGFARRGKRIANWLRKEYKAASRSRLALIRLVFSLCAFFLVLACTAILVFYTMFYPSKSTADAEEDVTSEADTADTAERDTEAEEGDEEEGEEEEEAEEKGAYNKNTSTTGGDSRENIEATASCRHGLLESPRNSGSGSITTDGRSNQTRTEEPRIPSVDDVRRRAEKMLRKRR